jgi:eukaryotic-like serine/threonine-protein kinase
MWVHSLRHPSLPNTDDSEDTRAFLQARVALFWKVLFFLTLFGSCLGLIGAIKARGLDLIITLGETALAGTLWWLCRRRERSLRFSRIAGRYGFIVLAILGAFQGRYLLAGVVEDHAIVSAEGAAMTDAYVTMMGLMGSVMFVAIRAALIPSRPRRTIIITALIGVPQILVAAALVPTAHGGLAWRGLDSSALPWLPANAVVMWGIAIITCAVISKVIYGLRVEVRQAARFGQYVLERKIGEGAMGVVYRATHAMLRRPAAIKLLLKDRVSDTDLVRFEREVQLTSRLTHPNTIAIFDYGRTSEGVFYYAMEYLDGLDLQRLVEQMGPLEPPRAIHILAQICGALAEAHALGLIHRDIKPANIVLTERPDEPDVVKVVDFGLVRSFEGNPAASAAGEAIVGTPLYMAPEAISRPATIDGRSDLYAVGAVAYFLLTGQHVFRGASVLEVCSKHMLEAPVPPSQRLGRSLAADLEAIVLGCLAKDPDARPASAATLRTALLACADAARIDLPAARAWWRARRASEKDSQARSDDGGFRPGTMAIDLDHRDTGVHGLRQSPDI